MIADHDASELRQALQRVENGQAEVENLYGVIAGQERLLAEAIKNLENAMKDRNAALKKMAAIVRPDFFEEY